MILTFAKGHSWRLTGDASATWSFITSSISTASSYAQYVDFYAHGDMDMMEASFSLSNVELASNGLTS